MDRFVRLKDGALMPKLGQGTWFLGEDKSKEQDEIKSIKIGIENPEVWYTSGFLFAVHYELALSFCLRQL